MDVSKIIYELVFSLTKLESSSMSHCEEINLKDTLGYTSLNFVQLFIMIEEEFDISLDYKLLFDERIRQFGFIVELIKKEIVFKLHEDCHEAIN